MRISRFPWYDLPELRTDYERLWSVLANHLRLHGVDDVPEALSHGASIPGIFTDPNLLIGQCCGYDVIYGFAGSLEVVGSPCFSAPECGDGDYSSCVLVREADAKVRALEDLRGAVCAINGFNSHSGTSALRSVVAPLSREGRFFSGVKVSGGHRKSLALLLAGEVDVMAMDGFLHELIRTYRPEILAGTRILCWSAPAPAPPFVTSAATDREDVEKLRAALRDTFSDDASKDARAALLLDGVKLTSIEDYDRILDFEGVALRHGYKELHASSPIVLTKRG
jgi:ABC-type phosphate/phosphonate transport system substrate-binding protein